MVRLRSRQRAFASIRPGMCAGTTFLGDPHVWVMLSRQALGDKINFQGNGSSEFGKAGAHQRITGMGLRLVARQLGAPRRRSFRRGLLLWNQRWNQADGPE